jgi:MFS transporter, DHA1 family, tetracycline resistance protein
VQNQTSSLRIRSLWALFIVFFADNLGLSIGYPLVGPLLLKPEYGLIGPEITLAMRNILIACVLAVFSIAQFFGAPFWGDLADQYGRKKIFYFTILGTLVGYLLSGLSLTIHSLSLLIISRAFTGFFAGNLSLCLTSIADLNPNEKKRAKTFGWIAALGGISWVIGILMGGEAADPLYLKFLSIASPFWITAILSLFSFIVMVLFFTETKPSNLVLKINILKAIDHVMETIRTKELRKLYLILFFWMLGWALSIQWFSAYSAERFHASIPSIMISLVILGILWSLGGTVTNGLLLKKLSLKNLVIFGLAATSVGLIIAGISPLFIGFAIFYLIASHFGALSWSNTLNLVSISAPSNVQGKTMGFGQSMLSLGQLLAPLIGGVTADTSLHLIYILAGVFVAAALILLLTSGSAIKNSP